MDFHEWNWIHMKYKRREYFRKAKNVIITHSGWRYSSVIECACLVHTAIGSELQHCRKKKSLNVKT
jgi:hypothetical protein